MREWKADITAHWKCGGKQYILIFVHLEKVCGFSRRRLWSCPDWLTAVAAVVIVMTATLLLPPADEDEEEDEEVKGAGAVVAASSSTSLLLLIVNLSMGVEAAKCCCCCWWSCWCWEASSAAAAAAAKWWLNFRPAKGQKPTERICLLPLVLLPDGEVLLLLLMRRLMLNGMLPLVVDEVGTVLVKLLLNTAWAAKATLNGTNCWNANRPLLPLLPSKDSFLY